MAKVKEDGNVNMTSCFHETIYNELFEAKKRAHKRAKKKDPANVGNVYSWGKFFLELYRFAVKEGFYNE